MKTTYIFISYKNIAEYKIEHDYKHEKILHIFKP